MTKVCNQCENEYQQIGQHWVMSSSCNHKEFTEHQYEMITGILMGDGHINTTNKNPRLEVKMTSPNYLNYIANKFGILGNKVKLKRKAEEIVEYNRKTGFKPNAKKENYSDLYEWDSISHPELDKFADWYESGEKIWPKSIELTPTVLKHWYCGDGSWHNSGTNRNIVISMSNEIEERKKVSKIFENVGLPSPSNYSISERKNATKRCDAQFTVDQSRELWEYMGKPLPDFEYKWPEKYH